MGTSTDQIEIKQFGFGLLSGMRRDNDGYSSLTYPPDSTQRRKGALALLVEGAGDHPSLSDEACAIAIETITRAYYEDNALSVTTALLNAIELANSAVLEHCYAPATNIAAGAEPHTVAVGTSGSRARGARVGLTAVLFRPDGTGIYLSQLAPTQAYLVHNGMVSALPEPRGWRAGREGVEEAGEPITFLPAQSLGSRPGLVTDLTFRRMEPGDRVVLLSTSVARLVDRSFADGSFFASDPTQIRDDLYELAARNSVARASAVVLEIGEALARPATVAESPRDRKSVLAAPLGWLDRSKRTDRAPEHSGVEADEMDVISVGGAYHAEEPEDDFAPAAPPPPYLVIGHQTAAPEEMQHEEPAPLHVPQPPTHEVPPAVHPPTLTLVQRHVDPPPYLAALRTEQQEEAQRLDEADGWEDAPPIMASRPVPTLKRLELEYAGVGKVSVEKWRELYQRTGPGAQEAQYRVLATPTSPPPQIFGAGAEIWDDDDSYEEQAHVAGAPAGRKLPRFNVSCIKMGPAARQALQWSKTAIGGLMPDRRATSAGAPDITSHMPQASGRQRTYPTAKRPTTPHIDMDRIKDFNIPRKPFFAAVIVSLVVLLAISMLALGGGDKGKSAGATADYLQQARQAELAANQPGNSEAARREGLKVAREKATQALAATPDSAEAKRLLTRIESDLDRIDGVTRLRDPKLIFDLDAMQGGPTASAPVSGTGVVSDLVISSNNAYMLDKASGTVYRCQLSTQACAPSLKSGDSAGGRTVGQIVAVTQRVGNALAIDDTLTAYLFDATSETWSAEPLGNAAGLGKPLGVATYDGHLYLLGSKPGQISKYSSGAYSAPPADWIADSGSVAQVKEPVALAIDGAVYILLTDGRVLIFQGGKLTATLTPKSTTNAPATGMVTDTNTRDLYILYGASGTITRLTKEGQTLVTLRGPEGKLQSLNGLAVDEGKSKLYLIEGRKVYEAVLPGRPVVESAPGGVPGQDAGQDGEVAPAGPPVQAAPTARP
jgi:hypothetical protein